MTGQSEKQRQLAIAVVNRADDLERDALLNWAYGLLEIKNKSISSRQKAKEAIRLTASSKVIVPAMKLIGKEVKRHAWDERSTKSRFGLIGAGIGITVFGGQGAGN